MDHHNIGHPAVDQPSMLFFPRVSHELDSLAIGIAVIKKEEAVMKITRKQAMTIAFALAFMFIMDILCYGSGYIAHNISHGGSGG